MTAWEWICSILGSLEHDFVSVRRRISGTPSAHLALGRNSIDKHPARLTAAGMSVGCRCEDQIGRSRFPVTIDSVTVLDHNFREADLNEAALRRTHSRVAEPTVEVI